MKTRTKFEKDVERLSRKLEPIGEKHVRQAIDKCLPKQAWYRRRDMGTFCCCCGHWFYEGENVGEIVKCPNCGERLAEVMTRRQKDEQYGIMAILTVCGGYQVIRILEAYRMVDAFQQSEKRVFTNCHEVVRFWIDENGKYVTQTEGYGVYFYNVRWHYGKGIELRNPGFSVNYYVDGVYSPQRILPTLKRNGFKGDLHGFTPLTVFCKLLKEPMVETLWKAGRFDILKHVEDVDSLRMSWPAIRIVLRNNYKVDDWKLWFDMVGMMRQVGMDFTNPKYVCPPSVKETHDFVHRRVEAVRRRKEKMELDKELRIADRELAKKKMFFGVSFGNGEISVTTLSSAREYYDEGKHMHHCVYDNEYWKKQCLILSARDAEGNRLATVELSLRTFTITQCRAAFNKVPERNKEIMEIINGNIYRYKQLKKKAKCSQM